MEERNNVKSLGQVAYEKYFETHKTLFFLSLSPWDKLSEAVRERWENIADAVVDVYETYGK